MRDGLLGGSLLAICLGLAGRAAEELPPPIPEKPVTLPAAPALVLDLPACRLLALEKQPALAAYRASLAATLAKVVALDNLGRLASLLRKDLCIRQRQASLGVKVAEARLHQAECETLYAVTRLYWTAVYAKSQLAYTDQVLAEEPKSKDGEKPKPKDVTKLKTLYDLQAHLKEVRKLQQKADKWTEPGVDSVIALVQAHRVEARQGYQRALAALREAIGLEPCIPLALRDDALPNASAVVCREYLVALALSRRDEIAQALLGAEIAELEIEAQCLSKHNKADTFASGADLHSQPTSPASFGDDYHPAVITLDVPAILVGPPCLRVEQAKAIHARALAVVAKARGLIGLEAEDAYLRWEEAHRKQGSLDQAVVKAEESTKALLTILTNPPVVKEKEKEMEEVLSKATINDAVDSVLRTALFREQAGQNRLQEVLQLAALERITAGGICPVYEMKKTAPDKDDNADQEKDKKQDKDKGNEKEPAASGEKPNRKSL